VDRPVAGTPTFQFFKSLAEVFQDLVVDEFDLTFRAVIMATRAGDAIDDQGEESFRSLTEGSFIAVQVGIELGVFSKRDSGLAKRAIPALANPVRRERRTESKLFSRLKRADKLGLIEDGQA